MEGIIDSGALETLISITGASEAVGTRLLQATRGDLNAAVDAFYNDGDLVIPLPDGDDTEREDWMERDEPAVGVPVHSVSTFRHPGAFPVPDQITQSGAIPSTEDLTSTGVGASRSPAFASGGFLHGQRPDHIPQSGAISIWDAEDLTSIGVGASRSPPFGRGGFLHRQRPDVRNIPIDWRDGNEPVGSSYPNVGVSNPRIVELPEDGDSQQLPGYQHQAIVDEEDPSTASSVFRSGGEAIGRRRFGEVPHSDEELDPDFNPNAPHIAEVPVMAIDEGSAIEEEMLRAAIEASRREAEEALRRGPADLSQVHNNLETTGIGNPASIFPSGRTNEDDDLARAVTLSLKTAEAEKAQRERGEASSDIIVIDDDDEDNTYPVEARTLVSMRRRGVARDRTAMARGASGSGGPHNSTRDRDRRSSGSRSSGSSTGAIISSPPDESEEVEEQPLLRRRTRRSMPSITEPGVMGGESHARNQFSRGWIDHIEPPFLPSASMVGSRDAVGGLSNAPQQHDDPFASEWGGISSEEHDEAVMLEAALFGGLPDSTGHRLPYPMHRGIHNDMMDSFMGDGANYADPFNRRGFPQPPSPTVVAQRLIREQQDDEYLASLAADRIKELKAIEEAEARRQKEQEAAEAAASEEKLRHEENLKKQQEAENLERQLALKKESLPPEPSAEEQGALTLVIRLPDGSRRGRRFHKTNELQSLFDFIDVGGGVKPGTYRLVRQYPRVVFTDGDHGSSLESLGLTSKQEVLFLETI